MIFSYLYWLEVKSNSILASICQGVGVSVLHERVGVGGSSCRVYLWCRAFAFTAPLAPLVPGPLAWPSQPLCAPPILRAIFMRMAKLSSITPFIIFKFAGWGDGRMAGCAKMFAWSSKAKLETHNVMSEVKTMRGVGFRARRGEPLLYMSHSNNNAAVCDPEDDTEQFLAHLTSDT